jgi:hypothetical protein
MAMGEPQAPQAPGAAQATAGQQGMKPLPQWKKKQP